MLRRLPLVPIRTDPNVSEPAPVPKTHVVPFNAYRCGYRFIVAEFWTIVDPLDMAKRLTVCPLDGPIFERTSSAINVMD